MKQPDREFKNTHYNKFGNWEACIRIGGIKHRKAGFKTERGATIEADKMLLENGKEPVNILKRK